MALRRSIILGAAAVVLAAGAARPAGAQLGLLPQVRVKAGLFVAQNASLRHAAGETWLKIGADATLPLGLGLLGSRTRVGVELAMNGGSTIVPVTLSQVWQPSLVVRSPVYFGVGIGLWTAHIEGSGTASRLGLRLLGGVDWTRRFFTEVEYDLVDRLGGVRADGVSVLAGIRF